MRGRDFIRRACEALPDRSMHVRAHSRALLMASRGGLFRVSRGRMLRMAGPDRFCAEVLALAAMDTPATTARRILNEMRRRGWDVHVTVVQGGEKWLAT